MSSNMHKGMKSKSPSASDASTKPRGGDVNKGATRSGVAASPRSLGPREKGM